jgi:hypothetical protein
MSRKTDAVVASTIGIDTGKNTLHLIGLDEQGTIILRKRCAPGAMSCRIPTKARKTTKTTSSFVVAAPPHDKPEFRA